MDNTTQFNGYIISKKQVLRDKNRIRSRMINDKEYATVLLPRNINYGGILDSDGNPVHMLPQNAVASYLVPIKSVQNHRYNDSKYYISVPEGYHFRISVDLGATGNTLQNGKREHTWTTINNVSVDQMREFYSQGRFVTFTISKGQQGKPYFTKDGSQRTTVLIPSQGGQYAGGRISCSTKLLKEIPGHSNILQVSLPSHAVFAILKSEIIGENPKTGKPVFGESKVIGRLKGFEIADLFKMPEDKELTIDNQLDEADKDHEAEEGEELE